MNIYKVLTEPCQHQIIYPKGFSIVEKARGCAGKYCSSAFFIPQGWLFFIMWWQVDSKWVMAKFARLLLPQMSIDSLIQECALFQPSYIALIVNQPVGLAQQTIQFKGEKDDWISIPSIKSLPENKSLLKFPNFPPSDKYYFNTIYYIHLRWKSPLKPPWNLIWHPYSIDNFLLNRGLPACHNSSRQKVSYHVFFWI